MSPFSEAHSADAQPTAIVHEQGGGDYRTRTPGRITGYSEVVSVRPRGADSLSREELGKAVARLLDLTDHRKIEKWVQFPKALFVFLVVPGDPESGAFYLRSISSTRSSADTR